MECCSQVDIGFYLASCEKTESGGCVDEGDRYNNYEDSEDEGSEENDGNTEYRQLEHVNESSIELQRMVNPSGILLARNIELSEDDFVSIDPFDHDPDKEEYEGYMGNWGPDATHFYHDSVPISVLIILTEV